MAEFDIYKLVYVLFVTSATTELASGLRPYTERSLADQRICHALGTKGYVELSSERNASIIVTPSHAYNTWLPLCRFVFKAHKGEGLIAIVQNMYLRRNGSGCLDSITFRRKDRQKRVLCGHIDRKRAIFRVNQLYNGSGVDEDDFGEFDSEGEIETSIHLSTLEPRSDEKLDISIVYTPYKDCRKIKSYREDYREIPVSGKSSICMWDGYFCDGSHNCFSVLCRDEENCQTPMDVVSNGTGTKVTIGAVTTMLLCFIIFVMGLWICRKHKKLCWSSDCAGPSSHENRLQRGEREATADVAHPSVAVSPMLEVAVLPSVLDKDLPPSYDSLFPEQSNPSTT